MKIDNLEDVIIALLAAHPSLKVRIMPVPHKFLLK